MKIKWWETLQPRRDDTLCSAQGMKWGTRDLAVDVYLKDDGSDRIHSTVCQHWLDNEADVAECIAQDR